MSAFKVLSVSASTGTMVIDWGDVTLNHYIPQEVLAHPEIGISALTDIIESMRPVTPVAVEVAPALQALVEPGSDGADERLWRDMELFKWIAVRDRHRDQLELGVTTTLTAQQYSESLAYIQKLRDWPQSGDFPAKDKRPVFPQL
ncbi:phage tail assembly chaperone [Pseudomonas gingeri]